MKRLLQIFQNGSNQRSYLQDEAYKFIGLGTLFMVLLALAGIYLSPLLYMGSTALKSEAQLADPDDPLLPQSPQTYHYVSEETQNFRYTYRHPRTFEYEGQELTVYEIISQGRILNYALLEDRGDSGVFIDPENPDAGPIEMDVTPSSLKAAVEREQDVLTLDLADGARIPEAVAGLVGAGVPVRAVVPVVPTIEQYYFATLEEGARS